MKIYKKRYSKIQYLQSIRDCHQKWTMTGTGISYAEYKVLYYLGSNKQEAIMVDYIFGLKQHIKNKL